MSMDIRTRCHFRLPWSPSKRPKGKVPADRFGENRSGDWKFKNPEDPAFPFVNR